MARQSGFTLVELVVVVLILGILAAVAAPKILTTTGDASDSGISQTLANIRDAIELYKAVPANGGYPQDGGTPGTNDIATKLDGHLRGTVFPKVTVGGCTGNGILIDNTGPLTVNQATATNGWVYSETTGEIIINSEATLSDGSGIKYSEL